MLESVILTEPETHRPRMQQQQEHQECPHECHILCEVDHVDLLHLRVVHLSETMDLEGDAQQEDNQQNGPDHRIDAQQYAETSRQQDDSGSCHRQLGRRRSPRLRVFTHVVEVLEVVETGHQPVPAENDPCDQESDVHLGSFLSATLAHHSAKWIRPPTTRADGV